MGEYKPELTDLRSITIESKRVQTEVRLQMDWYKQDKILWLLFGECSLIQSSGHMDEDTWMLSAYLAKGATDFEHDSAYALKLPLVGLHPENLCVFYSRSNFAAWVAPYGEDSNFRVPRPGYNPLKHKGSSICKEGHCKKEPHIMVHGDFYVPPFDEELYEAVRGLRVEIKIGPAERPHKEK